MSLLKYSSPVQLLCGAPVSTQEVLSQTAVLHLVEMTTVYESPFILLVLLIFYQIAKETGKTVKTAFYCT